MKIQNSSALRYALWMFLATFLGAIAFWFLSRSVVFTFFATPARLNNPAYFEIWRPILWGFITGISVGWVCYTEKWFVDEAPDSKPSAEMER